MKTKDGYIFLNQGQNLNNLIQKLEEKGLTFISKEEGYRVEELLYCWKWNTKSEIKIIWNREFINDGMNEMDSEIQILNNHKVFKTINVNALLRTRLEIKLSDFILKEIVNNIELLRRQQDGIENTYDFAFLEDAHKYCSKHLKDIANSQKCACFFCQTIFNSDKIDDWIEEENDRTAICPNCGIDSVLPDKLPIKDKAFLKAMHYEYFLK